MRHTLVFLLLNVCHVDDAARAKSSMKVERYSSEAAQKQGEEWAQKAGSKIDSTVSIPRYLGW